MAPRKSTWTSLVNWHGRFWSPPLTFQEVAGSLQYICFRCWNWWCHNLPIWTTYPYLPYGPVHFTVKQCSLQFLMFLCIVPYILLKIVCYRRKKLIKSSHTKPKFNFISLVLWSGPLTTVVYVLSLVINWLIWNKENK